LPQPEGRSGIDFLAIELTIYFRLKKGFIFSNNQPALVEWPPFDQKIHLVFLTSRPFSVLTPPSLPQPREGASSTHWLSNWRFVFVSKTFYYLQQSTFLGRMDGIWLKNTFGVVGERYLLHICSAELAATGRKERHRLLGYRIDDLLPFQKKGLFSPTINLPW
jgi:hypothetical protein